MANRLKRVQMILGSSFGFGLLPGMPGTWGTIPAVVIVMAVYRFVIDEILFRLCMLGWLFMVCGMGYLLLPFFYESTGESDPRRFTLDEMAGYFVIPLCLGRDIPWWVLIIGGFLAFRFFDILKPPGARFFDRKLKGFVSVMGDDLISGLYSALLLYFLTLFTG